MPINIRRLDLNALPFSLTSQGALPDFPVVYAIFDTSQVFYVGATKSLFNRWSAHRVDVRLEHIIKRENVKVAWIAVKIDQLAEFESALIRFLNPSLNHMRQGKTYHYRESSYNRQRLLYSRLEAKQSNGNGHK